MAPLGSFIAEASRADLQGEAAHGKLVNRFTERRAGVT